MARTIRNLIIGYLAALFELYSAILALNVDKRINAETVGDYLIKYLKGLSQFPIYLFNKNLTTSLIFQLVPLVVVLLLAALSCKKRKDYFDFALLVPVFILPLHIIWVLCILFLCASEVDFKFSEYTDKPIWLNFDLWTGMIFIIPSIMFIVILKHRVVFSKWWRIKSGRRQGRPLRR